MARVPVFALRLWPFAPVQRQVCLRPFASGPFASGPPTRWQSSFVSHCLAPLLTRARLFGPLVLVICPKYRFPPQKWSKKVRWWKIQNINRGWFFRFSPWNFFKKPIQQEAWSQVKLLAVSNRHKRIQRDNILAQKTKAPYAPWSCWNETIWGSPVYSTGWTNFTCLVLQNSTNARRIIKLSPKRLAMGAHSGFLEKYFIIADHNKA